jgi:hypothetical protein
MLKVGKRQGSTQGSWTAIAEFRDAETRERVRYGRQDSGITLEIFRPEKG